MSRQYSQGQLDAIARQRGFPDYATWAAWNRNRSEGLQQAPAQQPPQNFLQSLLGKIPIHPSYLLNYVNDKINGK
jgi:muconolactone delta-isomerase